MKARTKILLMKIAGFGASIAPILIAVGFNWGEYTATVAETIKLSAGAIIVLFFLFLKSMGKLKLPEKRIVLYLILFSLAYLLQSFLNDFVLISGMALLGELLELPIEKKALAMEKEFAINEQAEATAKAIGNYKRDDSSGRV